jgi:predicted TIM-barrel fold metal-dependent hydrolase
MSEVGVTDLHIHIQPWRQLKPAVVAAMRRGKEDHWERLLELMEDPRALLQVMDESGIWRVGLINYPSPDVMGFTDETNAFAADYASAAPERLIPFGGVHPRFTRDPEGQVEELLQLGIRCLKIHPPHQVYPANAYTQGLEALRRIYRRCEERGMPVTIHTGTSIFPGARCKFGRPLWMDEAFFILRRHRNVYLEVSGIPPLKLLDYFPRLEEIGDRVLWGTDWPSPGVRDLRHNLEQFMSLPLPADLKARITRTTPLAVVPTR